VHPAELTTAGTDAVLAAVSAALAVRLHRSGPTRGTRFFVWALAGAAVAAGAGGLFHGLREWAPGLLLWLLWRLVPLGIAVTNTGFLLGVLDALGMRRRAAPLLYGKLAVVAVLSLLGNGLLVVGIDLGATLVALGGLAASAWMRGLAWAPLVAAGAMTTAAGLLVQLSQLRHGSPWNHNDVFHVMQALAFSLFCAAAMRMTRSRRSALDAVAELAAPEAAIPGPPPDEAATGRAAPPGGRAAA